MRYCIFLLLVSVCLGQSNRRLLLQSRATASVDSSFDPTNISGMAYYWNYNDATITDPVSPTGMSTWVDRIQGLAFHSYSSFAVPTNTGIGMYMGSGNESATNTGATVTNFSLWITYYEKEVGSLACLLANDSVPPGRGLLDNVGKLNGNWANGNDNSAAGALPANIVVSAIDSQGTVYTNGVADGSSIGTPAGNFTFSIIGKGNNLSGFEGYIKYIGLWTNKALTVTDATNLSYWIQTNGVTNVTGGLIGWWKFDEGSGTNITDSSGSGKAALFYGTPSWVSGVIGNAITLSGSTGYIVVTNSASFADSLTDMTVSFWVKDTQTSGQKAIITKENLSTMGGWTVWQENALVQSFNENTGGTIYRERQGQIAVNDGGWHHVIAYISNLNTIEQYTDGKFDYAATPQSAGTITTYSSANNIYMGVDAALGFGWDGTIDDMRIYNRVLTPKEIDILNRWRGQQ